MEPIPKWRDGNEVGNYKGITLMDTLYKLYSKIIPEIWEGKMEKRFYQIYRQASRREVAQWKTYIS